MAGFDFGSIAPIISEYMDTDEIDIWRVVQIVLPDGSLSVSDPNVPYASNLPCNISFNETDNANAGTVGVDPINISVTINCDKSIDLQNKDVIHARKLAPDGTVLERYEGVIGMPATVQSRKKAIMDARQVV
ncbi:MAG: hypothetical protein ACRDBM_15825 [Sporomusa sp.]